MHQALSRLIVYRNLEKQGILLSLAEIVRRFEVDGTADSQLVPDIYTQIHRLLDVSTQYGFDRDLWQCYLAWVLATTENPFSLACEKTGSREGSVNQLAIRDFVVFHQLLHYDFTPLEKALGIDCFSLVRHYKALPKERKTYNHSVSQKVLALREALCRAGDGEAFFHVVTDFYKTHGVGLFGLNQAFRVVSAGSDPTGATGSDPVRLEPITHAVEVRLDDLIGYDSQKQRLRENTESFLRGKRANNLLLYGDSGTGKSTCIKALRGEYHERGLRIIEIYKHQFRDLAQIISLVKNRNYKFILFMDDLSFEEFEIEYKYLKAVIEGGVEVTPDNVLIYATSNRRHLIRETWSDRRDARTEDDIHQSDTKEEKISLVNRFGVTIWFPKPDQQAYLEIVRGLVSRHPELAIAEDVLEREAVKWGLWNGSISGRRAQQFVNHLVAEQAFLQREANSVQNPEANHGKFGLT